MKFPPCSFPQQNVMLTGEFARKSFGYSFNLTKFLGHEIFVILLGGLFSIVFWMDVMLSFAVCRVEVFHTEHLTEIEKGYNFV